MAAGSGFAMYSDALKCRLGEQISGIDATRLPLAKDILALALPDFVAGKGLAAHEAELVYLRNKVALKTHERMSK
jgi:tRNA threonylcarbamoyladenosine biosynthesis protein TsaB